MNKKHILCPNCRILGKTKLKFIVNNFNIYFCNKCKNGFLYPVPENISKYYHSSYWDSQGLLGKSKDLVFRLFQTRRKHILVKFLKGGQILEIGAGEGEFEKSLNSNYSYTGIDFPGAKIKNKKILKVDFLKWKTNIKFDAVIFWESLEHTPSPQKYLEKASKLLNKNGYIFIEYPRFDCLESRFFGKHWFHLDPPRHLSHFTDYGLTILLRRTGMTTITKKGAFAFEYSIWGFVENCLSSIGIKSTDYLKRKGNFLILILLLPLIIFSLIFETMFLVINQSPIGFSVSKK